MSASNDGSRPEDTRQKLVADQQTFHHEVAAKEKRARRAREEGDRTLKYGLRAFGMLGWSIVVPTLLGVAVGLWLDQRFGTGIRFTLSLLVGGLILGMINAWKWMNAE